MIRIKPTRRFKVSNRLAFVGAMALSLTLFTGVDGLNDAGSQGQNQAALAAQTQPHDDSSDPAERRKRFSISRLLFGHG
jgi:hypothetical protein